MHDETDDVFISYAQNHEDVVLARALRPDRRRGSWIDVGAGHPVWDSVTAAFAERGWRGINVEPLPAEADALRRDRPHDVTLQVAVGAAPGMGKLFEGPPANRGGSTMVPGLADRYVQEGQEFTPIEVQVTTLADIVAEHVREPGTGRGTGAVDFLKIDVEGMEAEVLAGADWSSFRPRIVVVEATVPNSTEPSHEAWEPLLLSAGYRFALFDGLNRFYVEEGALDEEPELLEALSAPANVLDGYAAYPWVARVRDAEAQLASLGDVQRELERTAAAARRAQDELATALEDVAVLRDDLGAAQVVAARALGNREETRALRAEVARLQTALEAMHNTRTFRYLHPFRRAYSLSRRLARLLERSG